VGRYEVVRLVGEGAMGRVLLAHDPVLDRDVAVKYLRSDLKIPRDVRSGLLARMQHEARAAARVAHPNLVVLHDMGEDPGVGLFLVFEYVEGPTLKQRLLDDRRLPAPEAARLVRELSAALTVAHDAGILHRDVKPENIMLAKTGGKIADFGIARIPDSTLTHQGGLMGTPAYSAPETFRAGKFSPASDQFSLAASIYEAISGQRAFPGDDAVTVAARIASESPEPIAAAAGLAPAVDAVLGRALSRLPEDRFPTCEAFGAALSRSLSLPAAADLARADPPPASPASLAVSLPPDTTGVPARVSLIPPERRTGQVLLGGLLVVATAALVIRTALRAAESGPDPASPVPGLSAIAPSSSPAPARPPPLVRVPPRSARPRGEPSAPSSAQGTVPSATAPSPAGSVPLTMPAASTQVPAADAGPAPPASAAPASPSASERPQHPL
jgi:serine/threonine-protein kinase